jgi:hypothetical protein
MVGLLNDRLAFLIPILAYSKKICIYAISHGLVVRADDQEDVGSNPGAVYWMDVHENNENIKTKPKKIFIKIMFLIRKFEN